MHPLLRQRDTRIVAAVFATGLAVRILFMVGYRPAFLGIPDSTGYLAAGHQVLFLDFLHPAGYALFLRIVGVLAPNLGWVIGLQHLLGVVAAGLLYLTVRRASGARLLGLIPAGFVLFDGLELWTEHTPLSDPLFVLLVAAMLHEAVRIREGNRVALVTTAVLLAGAGLVRTVGLFVIPLVLIWVLLATPGRVRARLAGAGALAACALVLLAGYTLVQHAKTGFTGTTRMANRALYARVAPFADCRAFSPPPGTQGLCQRIPPSRRGEPNSYLWGVAYGAPDAPHGDRGVLSPAWRLFGAPPGGDRQLRAFAGTAILHQPLDYLDAVTRDFRAFWTGDVGRGFDAAAAAPLEPAVRATEFYGGGRVRPSGPALGVLEFYGRWIQIQGPLMILLLLGSLAAVALSRRRDRATAAFFGATGWVLLVGSVAAGSVDPRYALPALGPLGVALALGAAGALRVRVRNRSATSPFRWLRRRGSATT